MLGKRDLRRCSSKSSELAGHRAKLGGFRSSSNVFRIHAVYTRSMPPALILSMMSVLFSSTPTNSCLCLKEHPFLKAILGSPL